MLKKNGAKDPRAGSMNSIENIFVLAQAPLTLKTKKINIVAKIMPNDIAFVAKTLLHTILPIKNGCKNIICPSIYKNFSSFSSCYFSYSS